MRKILISFISFTVILYFLLSFENLKADQPITKQSYSKTNETKSGDLASLKIKSPFSKFLESEIESVIVETGQHGGYEPYSHFIKYRRENQLTFKTDKIEYWDNTNESYKNSFSSKLLDTVLNDINQHPDRKLSYEDLDISQEEKNNYLNFVRKMKVGKSFDVSNYDESRYFYELKPVDINIWIEVLNNIESTDKDTLKQIIGHAFTNWRCIYWLKIHVVNERKDTIKIHNSSHTPDSWIYPWTVEVNELSFPIINVKLLKFFESIIHESFRERQNYKIEAIHQIVRQLYKERMAKQLETPTK